MPNPDLIIANVVLCAALVAGPVVIFAIGFVLTRIGDSLAEGVACGMSRRAAR